jgi:hypothetical protein
LLDTKSEAEVESAVIQPPALCPTLAPTVPYLICLGGSAFITLACATRTTAFPSADEENVSPPSIVRLVGPKSKSRIVEK